MHSLNIKTGGIPLERAEKVLIMIHGRGGSAEDVLGMANYLHVDEYALIAPQATNHTWYPYSFMAPMPHNEPWLSSAIDMIGSTVDHVLKAGVSPMNIYFFGFSQGACLSLEYLARNGKRYGGVTAIIGGLIGEELDQSHYQGDFQQTPVFIGTSDPDPHVPVSRVYETRDILMDMNADIKVKVYKGFGHSINQEEIDFANQYVFK